MEIIHIETKYQGRIILPKELLVRLPNNIILCTTIQYLDHLPEIQEQLKGKEVTLFKSIHGKHPGQILGCDVYTVQETFDAFLYIGDGRFHPTALRENKKPIIMYNPLTDQTSEITVEEIEKYHKRKKGLLLKYLTAQTIGILVTTKPGQSQQKAAERLKEKIEKEGRKAYLFIGDTLDLRERENFPFIEAWVNTACPRMQDDANVLNIKDIKLD